MFKTHTLWNSLVVQWLGLAFIMGLATGSIPFQELKSCLPQVLPKKKKTPTSKGHSISLTFYWWTWFVRRLSVYAFLIKKPGRRLCNLHFGRIPSSDYFPWRDCSGSHEERQECSYSAYWFYSGRKLVSPWTCRRIELWSMGQRQGGAIGKVHSGRSELPWS